MAFSATTPLSAHLIRCVRVTAAGGPSALAPSPLDLSTVDLSPNELLVRTSFAGVNFIDTYYRTGLYNNGKGFPYIPGDEGCGAVVKCGAQLDAQQWLNKRVAFCKVAPAASGSYSSFTVVRADDAYDVPDSVPDDVACAAMLQGLTAHYLTTTCFPCRPNTTVVVHAAAGGTGLLICQMAKKMGSTVIGVCGGADKAALATTFGHADRTIDYTSEAGADWSKVIREWYPDGVDAVLDGVGKATFSKGLEVLRKRGSMVTFGNASGPVDPIAPLALTKHGSISLQRPSLSDFLDKKTGEDKKRVKDLFEWLGDGSVKVHIGKVFGLGDADKAHELLESRGSAGKILINCQE